MKCEFCDSDKIWKGSLRDGGLVCEHCTGDDGTFNVQMANGSIVRVPKGTVIVTVGGGGGGGCSASQGQGAICVGGGGSASSSGASTTVIADADMNYMDYDI